MCHNEIYKFVTGKARNFKFGTRIDLGKSNLMDQKNSKRERGGGPWAEFINFGILPKFGTGSLKLETSNLVH